MPRRRQTDPGKATLAKVMGDMGFGVAIISQITDLPRQTVNDIVKPRGFWHQMPRNELYETLRERLIKDLEKVADGLAMKAIARLEEKLSKASIMESLAIFNGLSRIGD